MLNQVLHSMEEHFWLPKEPFIQSSLKNHSLLSVDANSCLWNQTAQQT